MMLTVEKMGIFRDPFVQRAAADVFIETGGTVDLPRVSEQKHRIFRVWYGVVAQAVTGLSVALVPPFLLSPVMAVAATC